LIGSSLAEPLEDEKEAIETEDEVVGVKEVMEA